jgi:hypothetical protein
MFFRWFLFLWVPDEDFDFEEETYPSANTIGAQFLRDQKNQLDSLSQRVLETALREPLSFWQVAAIEPNRGVSLHDLLLDRQRFVEEISGSHQMRKWDILLASLQEFDNVCVFNITSPFMLPPTVSAAIKNKFSNVPDAPDTVSDLFDLDFNLIYFYQELVDELFDLPTPELRNMDGEELIFTKSVYTIDPSKREEVVDALIGVEQFRPAVGNAQKRDAFVWADAPEKPSVMEEVTKGRLRISQDTLVTECNSAERDNQMRRILRDLLGDGITHRQTTSEPVDLKNPLPVSDSENTEPLNLEELPEEVRDQLTAHLENMYLKWADQSIPALNHSTPRDAVKSPQGREQVIDLINDWENKAAHMENQDFVFDFNKLRETLGLPLT